MVPLSPRPRARYAPLASTSVLVAEDEDDLRLALCARCGEEGYRVESAADGEEALARALAGPCDLAILDVTLPRRSGLDVCQDLRRRGFAGSVILVTDRADAVDRAIRTVHGVGYVFRGGST